MARLPSTDANADRWGTILNEFLRVSHREDGTLKGGSNVTNVRDFGAQGDGRTNDTTAFQQAAAQINAAGGGMLLIPPGEYIVGRQNATAAGYRGEEILLIHHCAHPVIIQGSGAVLKAADGLRLGLFDLVSGQASANGQPSLVYQGMIDLQHNAQVTIRDLELDGNSSGLMLGARSPDGRYDTGAANGIYMNWNQQIVIEHVHTHHHGIDGLTIENTGIIATDGARPHTLINVVSEYNGRLGVSWNGGIGLTAINCKFNHTGRARFTTSPAAGLNIEPEDAICQQGLFLNCEFVNNVGCGVTAGYATDGHASFKQCLIWGTSYYALIAGGPRLSFEDCTVYGSCLAHSPHGSFVRCHFEDQEYPATGVYRSTALIESEGDHVLFDDCIVVANQLKGIYFGAGVRKLLRNTTITHRYDRLPEQDFQSLLRGCVLENVRFEEDIRTPPATAWHIGVENTEIIDNVFVQGPYLKWSNCESGLVGGFGPTRDIAIQDRHLVTFR